MKHSFFSGSTPASTKRTCQVASHIFTTTSLKVCVVVSFLTESAKNVGFLFQLPLNQAEDEYLVEFLKANQELDYLVVYFMQRSRYLEALQLHDSMKGLGESMDTDLTHLRSALIENCRLVVPEIQV